MAFIKDRRNQEHRAWIRKWEFSTQGRNRETDKNWKENYIIIFGIDTENKQIDTRFITQELKTLIYTKLNETHINDIFSLEKIKYKISFLSEQNMKTLQN